MPSQTAENVNSPTASSTFFNGIADSLAAIIGSMLVAFACGDAGRFYRAGSMLLSQQKQHFFSANRRGELWHTIKITYDFQTE